MCELSGNEEFKVISKHEWCYWNELVSTSIGLYYNKLNRDNVEVAVLIDVDKSTPYYAIVYKNTGNPKAIHLLNPSSNISLLKFSNTTFDIQLKPGSLITLDHKAKIGYEGYLNNIGITKLPWLWTTFMNKSEIKRKERLERRKKQKRRKKIKRCYGCKIKKSDTMRLRLCSKCKTVRYCSRHCQKKSWNKVHRYFCVHYSFNTL